MNSQQQVSSGRFTSGYALPGYYHDTIDDATSRVIQPIMPFASLPSFAQQQQQQQNPFTYSHATNVPTNQGHTNAMGWHMLWTFVLLVLVLAILLFVLLSVTHLLKKWMDYMGTLFCTCLSRCMNLQRPVVVQANTPQSSIANNNTMDHQGYVKCNTFTSPPISGTASSMTFAPAYNHSYTDYNNIHAPVRLR